jgi:death-on-curing protein
MIRYLTVQEVIEIHAWALEAFGGLDGIRDQGMLDSAVVTPQMAFGGVELYPTPVSKAASLAYSLAMNHPFQDGNKRTAFWAMDTFLRLNGHFVDCETEEGTGTFLSLAAGELSREQLTDWLAAHCRALREMGQSGPDQTKAGD